MPPKAKFTKEEIIITALDIVEKDGIDSLTARSLGKALGSSARPIFTVFNGMDEVISEIRSKANEIYGRYVMSGLCEKPAFRGVGKAYIRFAAEHPRLFMLLFMSERTEKPGRATALPGIEEHYEEIVMSIINEYGVCRKAAIDLYFHLWVYSHGIAVLIATKTCAFDAEQITAMMGEVFKALLKEIKTEGKL